jgi:hypothetical protein
MRTFGSERLHQVPLYARTGGAFIRCECLPFIVAIALVHSGTVGLHSLTGVEVETLV